MVARMGGTRQARAATAYADAPDTRAAATQAAREALDAAGGGPADLAIAFHHGRHDPAEVRAGIVAALGETPVLGGSAAGVITNDALGYEGHQIGVAVVTGAPGGVRVLEAGRLAEDGERAVGERLGAALGADARDVLFLYSSIRTGLTDPAGLSLYFGTPLLAGLEASAPELRGLAGAGLIDSLQPSTSHVFGPSGVMRDGVVGLALGEPLRMDTFVMHGCRPSGGYHEITATDGPMVLEIDGRPALDVMEELTGGAPHDEYPFRVILGVNRGERYGPYDETSYQTRLCLAVVPERKALVMFEPDLEPGAQVQLMRISLDFDYVGRRVREAREQLDGRRPLLALYADCAGRCSAISPLEREEGDAVREAIGDIPLLGFYTGVEVARVGEAVRPLDWTGVLCLLSV